MSQALPLERGGNVNLSTKQVNSNLWTLISVYIQRLKFGSVDSKTEWNKLFFTDYLIPQAPDGVLQWSVDRAGLTQSAEPDQAASPICDYSAGRLYL